MAKKAHARSNKKIAPKKKSARKEVKKPRQRKVKEVQFNIEDIINWIIDGLTYRAIAKKYKKPVSTIHYYCAKVEHSARVREALQYSADSYAEKAEEVLLKAKRNHVEMIRARELAQHYRWKASKRCRKNFGDKIDHTTGGDKLDLVQIFIPDNGRDKTQTKK